MGEVCVQMPESLGLFGYPKIETLFKRDEQTFIVNLDQYREQAFARISSWYVTEKIHGTNIRIHWDGHGIVRFAGRKSTDVNDIPRQLLEHLTAKYTPELLTGAFGDTEAMLFGEGCGPGIQTGGGNYAKEKTFILFDVFRRDYRSSDSNGYFLFPEDMKMVAERLAVRYAPVISEEMDTSTMVDLVAGGFYSSLARMNTETKAPAEGVVAIAPGLFNYRGERIIVKLKTQDFRGKVRGRC